MFFTILSYVIAFLIFCVELAALYSLWLMGKGNDKKQVKNGSRS